MSEQCTSITEKQSNESRRDTLFSPQLWISQDEIHSNEQSKTMVRLVKSPDAGSLGVVISTHTTALALP